VGDQTQDSQEATAAHAESAGALVSRQSARAGKIPGPEALPEVAGACSVRWSWRELPRAGGRPALCGAGVALVAEPAQSQKRHRRGEIPAAVADLCPASPQDRPHHRTGPCRVAQCCARVVPRRWRPRTRMRESLTYGTVGGPVGQPPALPGSRRPEASAVLPLPGAAHR